jgi:hypothetical protein
MLLVFCFFNLATPIFKLLTDFHLYFSTKYFKFFLYEIICNSYICVICGNHKIILLKIARLVVLDI